MLNIESYLKKNMLCYYNKVRKQTKYGEKISKFRVMHKEKRKHKTTILQKNDLSKSHLTPFMLVVIHVVFNYL